MKTPVMNEFLFLRSKILTCSLGWNGIEDMPIFSLESEDFFEKLKDLNKHLNHPLKSDPTRTKLTQKRFTLYQFIATMSLIEINKEVAPTLPLMSKISECSSEAAKFYTLACRAAIVTEIIKISEGNQDLRFHTTGIADIMNPSL